MTETAAALVILPFLAVLVIVLECTRIGCRSAARRWAASRSKVSAATPNLQSWAE